MKSRFIAGLAALALGLTAVTATPAMADRQSDNLLKLLLGGAAVALVIKELKDKKKKSTPVYQQPRNPRWDDRDRRRDQHGWRNRMIPSRCVVQVRTHSGRQSFVSGECVEDYGFRKSLPKSCAFELRGPRGKRDFYGSQCLARNGYQIDYARRY